MAGPGRAWPRPRSTGPAGVRAAGHGERWRKSEALTGRGLAVAWLGRGGDTDEMVAVPRPDGRSAT